jgi:hypothetical protein
MAGLAAVATFGISAPVFAQGLSPVPQAPPAPVAPPPAAPATAAVAGVQVTVPPTTVASTTVAAAVQTAAPTPAEVAGVQVEQQLELTGASSAPLLAVGAAATALGAMLVVGGKRRKQNA